MIEKSIRSRICNAIHRYAKANNKYMNDHNENKESYYLKYWDYVSCTDWQNLRSYFKAVLRELKMLLNLTKIR